MMAAANYYGDILSVECSGASSLTARRNGLREEGRQASYKMAEKDLEMFQKYKGVIEKVAKAKNLDPAVIAAIISRESGFGRLLDNGWGHDRECFGLMQISTNWHEKEGEWNSEEHISQGAQILVDMIKAIQRKFTNWKPEYQLKGGIAAYNCGATAVRDYKEADKETVGKDYSNDVVARAQWFKKECYLKA